MENKKENKVVTVVLVFLLLVIIGLLVLVVFKTKELKDENTKLNDEINTLQEQISNEKNANTVQNEEQSDRTIVGEYEYIIPHTDEPGLELILDFMEDGTYYMTSASTVRNWKYGTYQVNGTEIILNQEYDISNVCGSGIKKSETIKYTILDDNTIVTNNSQHMKKNNKSNEVAKSFKEALFLGASSECFPTAE